MSAGVKTLSRRRLLVESEFDRYRERSDRLEFDFLRSHSSSSGQYDSKSSSSSLSLLKDLSESSSFSRHSMQRIFGDSERALVRLPAATLMDELRKELDHGLQVSLGLRKPNITFLFRSLKLLCFMMETDSIRVIFLFSFRIWLHYPIIITCHILTWMSPHPFPPTISGLRIFIHHHHHRQFHQFRQFRQHRQYHLSLFKVNGNPKHQQQSQPPPPQQQYLHHRKLLFHLHPYHRQSHHHLI